MTTPHIDCYPFLAVGKSHSSKEKAWERFDKDLARQLKWIRGIKYWRVTPIYQLHRGFDDDRAEHIVCARITGVWDDPEIKHPVENLIEVSLEKPYPTDAEIKQV